MKHLLIFGLGYVGRAVAGAALEAGFQVTATTRSDPAAASGGEPRLVSPAAAVEGISEATHLLVTAPPDENGDPLLAMPGAAEAVEGSPIRWIGYLSTTGVYGDRGGAWVDEASEPAPRSERTRRRIAAEAAWSQFADRRAVDLFRLAGIYGPGRSALDEVRAGRARRVIKPGHHFGRIHRDDIARAVLAAMEQRRGPGARVLNLNDDEPAETARVIEEAARLLGAPMPPAIPFAEAERSMSSMARSFWGENRKVSSRATQAALGISWLYPSYREGLRAVLAEERRKGLG